MSTHSPRRIDRLCFLLRREPTVQTARNLERMSSLSLSKTQKPATARFLLSNGEENYSLFSLIHLTFQLIPSMSPLVLIFDTWHNLGHSSHPLTTHETCVTWVHVVGDFCHITCVTPRFPVRPDWWIRTELEMRDHILGLFT